MKTIINRHSDGSKTVYKIDDREMTEKEIREITLFYEAQGHIPTEGEIKAHWEVNYQNWEYL